jgi:monovalent cation:H+ antiporter, CPA1 family
MFASEMAGGSATVASFVSEMVVITAVALASRFFRVPYTLALVAAGLILGLMRSSLGTFLSVQLSPDLLFTILLPALLFEAAIHLDWDHIKERLGAILALAVPGLLISTGLVGFALHHLLSLDLVPALIFGALISATDPISVLALFKVSRAPTGLATIVEGESLLNDGAAVVTFNLLVALALGKTVTLWSGVGLFALESCGGLLLGAGLGWLCWKITEHIDDHLIEITLSTVLAYGSYLIAQALHTSGVMAVIAAGLIYGRHGVTRGLSMNSRLMLLSFWEYVGFLCNSLVFLLIGTQVDLRLLANHSGAIAVAFFVVLAARAVAVALLAPATRVSLRWNVVLFWSGVRGSIAMALAMAITLPQRETILLLTFGVVLFSLFLQGLTMGPLLRRLGLVQGRSSVLEYELRLGELLAQEAALSTLRSHHEKHHFGEGIFRSQSAPLEEKIAVLRAQLNEQSQLGSIVDEQTKDAQRLVRTAQLATLRHALADGLISLDAFDCLRDTLLREPALVPPPDA